MAVNQIIRERIELLREWMREYEIDYYLIPTADYHHSEYVSEYFKTREFFSGFTGSNGTLLVSAEEAGLWTDGRYFIQAERELAGTGILLYKVGEEGVPALTDHLLEKLEEGDTLGFDGRVVDADFGLKLERALLGKKADIAYERDLAENVWRDRPALPHGPITLLGEELAGESTAQKLARVREQMLKAGADSFLLSKLDDLMWLFNIRGSDVACNPVALCHGLIEKERAVLFVGPEALTAETREYFAENRVILLPYEETEKFLKTLPTGGKVLIDKRNCSYLFYKTVQDYCEVVERENPTEAFKAVKNETELMRMREVYLQDSAAVIRFLFWLKRHVGRERITEHGAAACLDGLRAQIDGFIELSFPTISAYGANAAMMHYEAAEEGSSELAPSGMLLVDSGGQYEGGTTDVTRTVVLGGVSPEIKAQFSAVVSGMLQLQSAKFLYGCTGRNLDILAREPLWRLETDYKCGTGHGVGYMLNVHEGPQNIRWRYQEGVKETVLEEGMVVTNEPGVYVAGSHGIRIENVMIVRRAGKNGDGQFMEFEPLTFVPIDREGLDLSCMTAETRELLNDYHRAVYEKCAPLLNEEERCRLREATRPL